MIAGLTNEQLELIKTNLKSGNRETIIELMSNGLNLPPTVKTLAYVQLQKMTPEDIQNLCDKVLLTIPLLQENRVNDLVDLLTAWRVPSPLITIIKSYGNHNNH